MRTKLLAVVLLSTVSGGNAAAATRPVVVRVESGGFHWLDAGIGAAATLAVVLLALAAAVTWRLGPVRSPLKREEP